MLFFPQNYPFFVQFSAPPSPASFGGLTGRHVVFAALLCLSLVLSEWQVEVGGEEQESRRELLGKLSKQAG